MTESPAAEDSMLDVDLDDAGEFDTLPGNSEHVLEITKAEVTDSRSRAGVKNLHLWLDAGEPTIDDIQVWIPIPNSTWKADDPKSHKKGSQRFKNLVECFGFSMPLNISQLIGLNGLCLVSAEEDDRSPGKFRNGVIAFQTGGSA